MNGYFDWSWMLQYSWRLQSPTSHDPPFIHLVILTSALSVCWVVAHNARCLLQYYILDNNGRMNKARVVSAWPRHGPLCPPRGRWDSILCGYRAGEKLKERRSIVCWSRYVLPIVLDTHVISSLPLLAVGSTEPRATNGRILDPFERKFIEKNQLYFANTNKRSEWHREQRKPFNNQNPFSPKFWTEGRQKEAICPDCRQASPSGYTNSKNWTEGTSDAISASSSSPERCCCCCSKACH